MINNNNFFYSRNPTDYYCKENLPNSQTHGFLVLDEVLTDYGSHTCLKNSYLTTYTPMKKIIIKYIPYKYL